MSRDQSLATGLTSPSLTPPVLPIPPTQSLPRLLWVDDSQMLLSLFQSVFQSLGFAVLATSCPTEALEHISLNGVDVAILDYDMPEMDGSALASIIKDRCPTLPVILYTGSTSLPHTARRWVDAVCAKAAPRAELLATIDRLWQNAPHELGNNSLRTFAPSSNH